MKSCPQCSRQVNDEFRFCSDCGFDFQTGSAGDHSQKSRKFKVHKHQVKKVKQIRTPQQQAPDPTTAPYPQETQPLAGFEIPTSPPPSTSDTPPPQAYPQNAPPYQTPVPYPGSQYPQEIDYKAKAEEDYSRGDYYAALDNYNLALMNNPGDFTILMAKERLLEMLNQKDEAVETLDQALKVQPENRELWRTKSRLLLLLYHEKGDSHYKKDSETAERTAEELRAQMVAKGMCPSCNGKGNCLKCHGSGSCHECGGTGVYKGVVKCQFCNGSGKCDRCYGSAQCPDCRGSGKLELSDCTHCGGNGLCSKCHGTGKHLIGHCKECDGTGYCPHCKGKGKIANMPKEQ